MTKRTYIGNNKKNIDQNGSIKDSFALENGYLNRSNVDNDGFGTAQRVFQNGSEEIRQLLLHECTLIFECQFCRNMFRSVNDFLNHKRSVCQIINTKYQHKHNTNTVNTQTDYNVCTVSTCTSPVAFDEGHRAEATKTAVMNFGKKYPELHNLLFPKTLDVTSSNDNQKTDVKMTENKPQNGSNFSDSKVHIARCRFSSTYVFQCPQCPMVFVQPAAAMKHMVKTHNRPRLGLRMLREAILKRRIQVLSENSEAYETKEDDCHCAYCKEVFNHSIDLSIHLLYCSVKDIVLQRRRVHFRHHSADYIRTAMEESKREHLDPTIPLDFSDLWPISRQKLTKARQKLKQMEAKHYELIKKSNQSQQNQNNRNISKDKQISAIEKIKRKKEKREKKEKKRAQKIIILSQLENKKNHKNCESGQIEERRLTRKTSLENSNKKTNADDTNSFSSSLSIENSENESAAATPTASPPKYNPCRCKICNKKFDGLGNVRRHISMYHYRANRFGCKLCAYRAFRRYDIVNHLGFVHKICEEREIMAVQYVVQHEVQTNLDVDDDIEMLSITSEELKSPTWFSKNAVGRPRKSTTKSVEKIQLKNTEKPKNLKRKDKDLSDSKRPIRNRIKPVEKDFVYDEDSKDKPTNMRLLRRRQSSTKSEDLFVCTSLLGEHVLPKVKGAAGRLLTNLVACGLASAASAPELPLERPKMRPHVSDMNRDGMQAGRVIEAQELEQARLKSTLLDDTFLAAKINQIKKCSTNKHNFRVKPSLAKELAARYSVTRNLLMKVNGESVTTENTPYIKQEFNPNDGQLELLSTESNSNLNEFFLLRNIKEEHVEDRDAEVNEDYCTPEKRGRLCDTAQQQLFAN